MGFSSMMLSIKAGILNYDTQQPLRIKYYPLGILQSLCYVAVIVYFITKLFVNELYYSSMESHHFFDVNPHISYVHS